MNDILQQNLINTFGLESLSDDERVEFLNELGGVALETTLVRFMADLNEQQVAALNYFIDTEPTQDVLMEHLLTQYQGFESQLETTISEIKSDAVAVLGDGKNENVDEENI